MKGNNPVVEKKPSTAPTFILPQHVPMFQLCIPITVNTEFANALSEFILDAFDKEADDPICILALGEQLRAYVENTKRFCSGDRRIRQSRKRYTDDNTRDSEA